MGKARWGKRGGGEVGVKDWGGGGMGRGGGLSGGRMSERGGGRGGGECG